MSRLIVGAGKGGGSESPDTLVSIASAKILDAISEGPIEGFAGRPQDCVYLNGIPIYNKSTGLYNYRNTSVQVRLGGADNYDSPISGFDRIEATLSSYQDSSLALETNITRNVYIPSGEANALKFTISLPGLLYTDDNGNISGSRVSFKVTLVEIGNGNNAIPCHLGSSTIGDTSIYGAITTTPTNTVKLTITSNSDTYATSHTLQYRLLGATTWITAVTAAPIKLVEKVWTGSQDNGHYNGIYKTVTSYSTSSSSISLTRGRYEVRAIDNISRQIPFSIESITSDDNIVISGKTTVNYNKDYEIPINPLNGPFTLQVTKTSIRRGSKDIEQLYLSTITLCTDSELVYPYTALAGLSVDARDFSGIPSRGYLMKLLKVKVPSNYTPGPNGGGTYSGEWDGLFKSQKEWTSNPVWCYYDLVTNPRYGLGDFITDSSLIDLPTLYTIAKYCDELVPDGSEVPGTPPTNSLPTKGFEPRFTCNTYIQNREDAYTLLNNFASLFRGLTYWDTSRGLTLVQDAPMVTTSIFTNANVIDGTFNYSGSAVQARHTVALVAWNDPQDNYRQKIEYVEDPEAILRYGVNQTDIVAFGCTSRGQAHRYGKHLLYTEANETEVVAFKSGLEGSHVYPGEVIEVNDKHRVGIRTAGRIIDSYPITNLLRYSESLNLWDKVNASVAEATNIQGPDSTNINSKVWRLTDNATSGNHYIAVNGNNTTPGSVYYHTVKVSQDTGSVKVWVLIRKGGVNCFSVYIDLITRTVSSVVDLLGTGFSTPLISDITLVEVGRGFLEVVIPTISDSTVALSTLVIGTVLVAGTNSYIGSNNSILISEPMVTDNPERIYLPTTSISTSTKYSIKTDKLSQASVGSSTISFINNDTSNGTTNYLPYTVTGFTSTDVIIDTPTYLPILNSIWSISEPVYPTKWRVLSIAEDAPNVYSINAVVYLEEKYNFIDFNVLLEAKPISILSNPLILPVTAASIASYVETRNKGNNTWEDVLILDWPNSSAAQSYTITYSINNGNVTTLSDTLVSYVEIPNIHANDSIEYTIVANGIFGNKSSPTTNTVVIESSLSVPSDVTNFSAVSLGDTAQLSWSEVTNDPDLSGYEVRYAAYQDAAWGGSAKLVDNIPAGTTSIVVPNSTGTYLIKARDYRGIFSTNASTVNNIFKTAGAPSSTITEDNIGWPGTKDTVHIDILSNRVQLDSVPVVWSWQGTTVTDSITASASSVTYNTATGQITIAGTRMPTGFNAVTPGSLAVGTTVILAGFTGSNTAFNSTIVLNTASTLTSISGIYSVKPATAYTDVPTSQNLTGTYGIPLSNIQSIEGGILPTKFIGYYYLTGSGGAVAVPYDAGAIQKFRITPDIIAYATVSSYIPISSWASLTSVSTLTGANPDEAGGLLEFATSDDNITYSGWAPLIVAADVNCRYVKFRLMLYTTKTAVIAEASQLKVYIT